MGLGKTFQSCATIHTLLTTGVNGKPSVSRPLILCPSSLVANWGKELTKWLGDKVQPIAVVDTRKEEVKKSIDRFGSNVGGWQRRGAPQILVMSYPTFRINKDLIYKKGIDFLICDEAHFLKVRVKDLCQSD